MLSGSKSTKEGPISSKSWKLRRGGLRERERERENQNCSPDFLGESLYMQYCCFIFIVYCYIILYYIYMHISSFYNLFFLSLVEKARSKQVKLVHSPPGGGQGIVATLGTTVIVTPSTQDSPQVPGSRPSLYWPFGSPPKATDSCNNRQTMNHPTSRQPTKRPEN